MPRLSQPLRFHHSNNILHNNKPTDRRHLPPTSQKTQRISAVTYQITGFH
jgi:hypothetical protein